MIKTGQKVRFIPECDKKIGEKAEDKKKREIEGVVTFVHLEHLWFTVTYNRKGTPMRESFKFSDIGEAVTVCG